MLVNCWLCWLFCYVNCVDCVNYVDNVDNVDNVSYVGELLMLAVAPAWGIAGVDSRNTPNWIIPRGSILFLYLSLYLFLSDQIQPFPPLESSNQQRPPLPSRDSRADQSPAGPGPAGAEPTAIGGQTRGEKRGWGGARERGEAGGPPPSSTSRETRERTGRQIGISNTVHQFCS